MKMDKNNEKFWDLVAGKLHGELDAEENEAFEKELEDPQKQVLFSKGQKIQRGLTEAKRLKNSSRTSSWNKVGKHARNKTIEFYARNFMKYAAILAVAFVAGYLAKQILSGSDQKIQYTEVDVQYGQTSHLTLFDGTEVWLNSGTKFRYPNKFNRKERSVYLEGEAFFKVAHNESLPFKVETGKMEVEDLGTSFNVSAYPEESSQSVVLVEGKVQINSPQGQKMGEMEPGQIAVKTDGSSILKIHKTDPYFYTSWKDGKVIFDGERLEDIAQKIERWYNVDILFGNESLKDYRLSGTILRNKPIDQMIMAIEMLAPIQFKYQEKTNERNQITITKK
jgi:ferric-dicitrate binding protein FerR (iron transport regulator)